MQVRVIRRPLHDKRVRDTPLQAVPYRFIRIVHETRVTSEAPERCAAEKQAADEVPAPVVPALLEKPLSFLDAIQFEQCRDRFAAVHEWQDETPECAQVAFELAALRDAAIDQRQVRVPEITASLAQLCAATQIVRDPVTARVLS